MEFAPLLLFVVPCWLIGCVFFSCKYFVRLKVDSFFTHADRSAGYELVKDHSRSVVQHGGGLRGENCPRESFFEHAFATFNFGPFFCVASKDCCFFL